MDLASLIVAVHRENFADREFLDVEIAELLDDYDLKDSAPDWVVELLSLVKDHRVGEAFFDEVGSDIGSVFLELSEEFGWIVADSGEDILMSFPVSSLDVVISREASAPDGTGCCSYRVVGTTSGGTGSASV